MTIWLLKNLPRTSPAPDDSAMQTRLRLKTKWPYDYKKTSPGLHLHLTTQPCEYDFILKPNAYMIIKNLTWTSPASNDSTMQIRLHLKTKWPYDYKKPPLDFTCIQRLNHVNTTSTQPCKYDFTLKPNDHMIIEQPPRDFTCIRLLNHANTTRS